MQIASAIAQLRTTDLAESIRFYTTKLGLTLEFRYQDFYAGIRAGDQRFHLKLVDAKDPSIEFVEKGGHFHLYLETADAFATAAALQNNGVPLVKDVHQTPWGTREFVIQDDQGHTLYFGQAIGSPEHNRSDGGGTTKPSFPGAVPEIPVSHIDHASAYYQTKLGFTLDWGGEELGLAGISRGDCRMFLANTRYRKRYGNVGPVLTWLNLDSKEDVDEMYRSWSSRQAKLVSKPESKPWGLHEFLAEDLDGNLFRVFHDFATPERDKAGA